MAWRARGGQKSGASPRVVCGAGLGGGEGGGGSVRAPGQGSGAPLGGGPAPLAVGGACR